MTNLESPETQSPHRTAELCKQVERIRLAGNVSQADLAKAAGVSRSTITRLANTGQGVSLDSFIRVLDALQLGDELDRLLSDSQQHLASPDHRDNKKRQRAGRNRESQLV